MSYESSYDTGGGSFRPNKDRGIWSSSNDFLFSCICNAFRMDVIYGIAVAPIIATGGIYMLLACLISATLYAIPIIYLQSFLGQFSSTGFISVFRIAPLFKGLGYIGVAINLVSLAFYSVFAGVPLLFFFHSLQPTIPWSCEGVKDWMIPSEYNYTMNHCALNVTEFDENDFFTILRIPSVEFFGQLVEKTFSFHLFGCVLVVWIAVAFVLYNTTERIGKLFRYCTMVLVVLLVIVFVRMIFLPGVKEGLADQFENLGRRSNSWEMWLIMAPMLSFATFGPGWGTVLSMASYNRFKTNISRYSLLICFSQIGVVVLVGLLCAFTESHLTNNSSQVLVPIFQLQWSSFLSIPSSLVSMDYPHLWTWMFLAVLIIGSFNLVVVQMFSVLTALFDEFEKLRPFRKEIIFGLAAILSLISAFFCTEDGIYFIEILADLNVASQALMNLILLIVVLWVYGRERFQRDVEFMTSQVFATWKVYIVRFATPIFLLFTLFVGSVLTIFTQSEIKYLLPLAGAMAILPLLALPGYCIYRLMQTNGTIGLRFKRCTKPSDWYPLDPEDRQRYEETIDNPETLHPLTTIVL